MKCARLSCHRRAKPYWSLCAECAERLLYGHVPPSSVARPVPASPKSAARPAEDWAPGELMEAWGK